MRACEQLGSVGIFDGASKTMNNWRTREQLEDVVTEETIQTTDRVVFSAPQTCGVYLNQEKGGPKKQVPAIAAPSLGPLYPGSVL